LQNGVDFFGVSVCSQGLCSRLAGKSVRFVGMMLVSRLMESSLLLAMNVLSLSVGIVTIMSAERGAKSAHSVKLGSKGSRVIDSFALLSNFVFEFDGFVHQEARDLGKFGFCRVSASCG